LSRSSTTALSPMPEEPPVTSATFFVMPAP
jgi:hypothetical protein